MNGRILVGGGTGFIGREVVKVFEKLDYEVVVIGRKKKDLKNKLPWNRFINFDTLQDEEPLRSNTQTWYDIEEFGLPSGTVAVVNAAGQNLMDPLKRWSPGFKQDIYNSRVNTNYLLAKAVTKSKVKPKAFVHMSGVGYYPQGPEIHDEKSKGGQHDFLARLVTDWEKAAGLPPDVPTRVVSLRSGVVLGRRGGLVEQTILPFTLGLGGRMGSGNQVMPWIHVKDVARLITYSVINNNCSGVYNAVSPHPTTNREFVKAYSRQLGRPAILPVPAFIFEAVFGTERANVITQSQTVLPRRTLESGFSYTYPTIEEAAKEFAHFIYDDTDPGEK